MDDTIIHLPKNIQNRYEIINSVYESLKCISQTAKALQISENTVNATRDWVKNGRPPLSKIGRPTKVTKGIRYYVAISTIFYPEVSDTLLAQHIHNVFKVDIKHSTVNQLRHSFNFKYGPRISSLVLSDESKMKRVNFSKCFFSSKIDHHQIVFSDECWFYMGSNNYYVWREKGKIYNTTIKESIPHPNKVMFWGAIGYNFIPEIVFFTSSVNSENYIDTAIKGSKFKESADFRFGVNGWILEQDNARPHTSRETQQALQNLGISVLPSWPPYSPDLSPIEVIWAIMKRRVEKYKPQNVEQLIEIVKFVWHNMKYETVNLLIDSFPLRLDQCIKSNGAEVRFKI